jgi:hypothetical protein
MVAALSSMFRQAVKRGKMSFNPCLGMDKVHKADPNANREWEPEEWQFARENAPLEIKICLFLARYAGLRGQTIVQVNRKQFKVHPLTGQAVRYKARKNDKFVNLPVLPELRGLEMPFVGMLVEIGLPTLTRNLDDHVLILDLGPNGQGGPSRGKHGQDF